MQITAFKAMLAREINIRGCEDYKNTFARMESDCTLRFGFKALIKSISFTKQSNLFLHFLSTWTQTTILRHCQTLQEHARNNASRPAKAFPSA